LTGESHRNDSGQAHFTKKKSNNESSTGNSKYKNLVYNSCHKKGHIRADCWTHKKKQQDANVTELAEGNKISVTFYLLQADQSVTKIDELLTLDVHSISVPIERYSSHTLRFKEERSSWEILLRAR